jgi:hypothetical protein
VLVAIVEKRLCIEASLYEMLQIFSPMLFEKSQLSQLFTDPALQTSPSVVHNQLNLFD